MVFLCATFTFVAGLYFLRNNIVLSIVVSLSYLIFLFIKFGKKKFIIFLSFFIIGAALPRISLPEQHETYTGFVIEARDNYIIFESRLHKYYVSSSENDFEVGDHLKIQGNISDLKFTNYESRFDFGDYLEKKGVTQNLDADLIDRTFKSPIKIHSFKKSFLSKFDEKTATLISAFLFNEKDYSNDLIQDADSSGILYLFSLSGIYLHVLFAALNYFLFIKFSGRFSRIAPFIVFLPFAFFSFTKIGTLRVYGLYLLKYLNEFRFKKKFNHIQLVSILAMFFLIIDYHLAYQEAFYIGFLLSAFSPFIRNATKSFNKKKRNFVYILFLRLLLLPIQIRSSYLDLFIPIKVLISTPLNFIFILFSILCVLTPFKFLFVITNKLALVEAWVLNKMDLVNTKIPFGNWGGAFTAIFLLVLIIILYLMESVRWKHIKICSCALIGMVLFSIAPLQEPITNAVYFINVGQGDSILINNKNKTVMIDTGGYKSFDMATESLIPFMNKKKITHIDALITTHDDFDHSGAKESLIENFKVNNYLSKPSDFPYKVGDLYFENLNTFNFTEENDCSLVLKLNFMNKNWLFMGDASTKVEEKILEKYTFVQCDVLKVGHHGSNTSSSEKFIKYLKPKEAIISVGATNYYGHPNQEVIDRLNKYNVKIRRTDLEGTISYFSLFA